MSDPGGEVRDLPALQFHDRDLPALLAPVCGVEESVPPLHHGWRTYASRTEVRALATDDDAELWAATAGGVLRWRSPDRFTRYGSEHGLPGNAIRDIVIDGTSTAWVVAGGLVSWLDGDVWRLCGPAADDGPSCLAVDCDGDVWAATAQGLHRVSSGRSQQVLAFGDNYAAGETPRAIAVVSADDAWMCSARGLFHFEDGRWCRHVPGASILTLALRGDALWLGTLEGPRHIDLSANVTQRWPLGPTTALAVTGEGVWAASRGHVAFYRDGDWQAVPAEHPDLVTALAATPDGGVCAGSFSGLRRCDFRQSLPWSTGSPPDLIGASAGLGTLIQAICAGSGNGVPVIWVGTPAGLFEFIPSTGEWSHLSGRRMRDVRALALTDQGKWVGSGSGRSGLRELHNGNVGPALMDKAIVALAADPAGNRCFAATADTVHQVGDSGTAAIVVAEELQPGTCLRTLAVGTDGTLWIGTDAGLFAFADATGTRVIRGDLVGAEVLAVLAAQTVGSQLLLVGTARGLYAGTPDQLMPVEELSGQAVTALAWAEVGTAVWAGTRSGLVHLACGAAGTGQAHVDSRGDWRMTTRLTAADSGLAADRVTALAVCPDRRLWIGTSSGLSSYQLSPEEGRP